MSRPSEAPRRRVLGLTNDLDRRTPPATASSRPIRAKVDLASSPGSTQTSSWLPTQPVRARVTVAGGGSSPRTGGGYASASTARHAPNAVFARTDASDAVNRSDGARFGLSPQTPTARAPSPARSRSPDADQARPVAARVPSAFVRGTQSPSTTPRGGEGSAGPPRLRGQREAFPTPEALPTASSPSQHYLPPSPSTRRLRSPTPRSPQATAGRVGSSASTASAPSLSHSSSSSTLLSPKPRPGAINLDASRGLYDSEPSKNGFPSRPHGASETSTAPGSALLPPVSVSGDERRAAFARSTSAMAPLSTQSPPKSPSLRAFPSQGPRDFPSHSPSFAQETGAGRTPTMRPPPSTTAPRSPFRPSSSPTRFGHARSRSTASVSSLSSAPSGVDEHVPSRPSAEQQLRAPVQEHASLPSRSPTSASPRSARPPLAAVDWIVAAAEDVENATAGRPAEARLSNGSVGQAALAGASESGVDEVEKEAKRDRRVSRFPHPDDSLF